VQEHNIESVAFPSISTGAYGFPIERACRIALREITAHLLSSDSAVEVMVVCFGRTDYDTYLAARAELSTER
jgi:O-acetyl-ADP-ribose deacetylase (regulator of RNase III)